MMQNTRRARCERLVVLLAGFALLTGCYVKDQLLEPQNPGIVDESAVASTAGALALRVGAIGRLRNVVDGGDERLWQEIGNITDEYKNADFQVSRADIDRRAIATSNGSVPYSVITQPRGFVRDAIGAMNQYAKDSTALIGELWMGLGFLEMSLAENYCNGIPLGSATGGNIVIGPPLSDAEVFDSASAHLDSALAINTQTNAQGQFVSRVSKILKARVLVDKGQWAAAAALVADVPTTYRYDFTTSSGTNGGLEDNGHWQVQVSSARLTVGDSFDLINGQPNRIFNALPFASAHDPRVPAHGPTGTAEDALTPMFIQDIWKNRDDPIPMASGIDARLIEAEAKLSPQTSADIPGMMAILNGLRRVGGLQIGSITVPVMDTLATPATYQDAVTLFFREKAFWTFGRGQRLSDLRRLIRQYGRTQDQVFPTGKFSFGGSETGTYGTDVNFPINDAELVNPLFHGCTDRNP